MARAQRPDYALGSHVAPLGLAWAERTALPPPFQRGMYIGLHGSWNRKPLSGYKVVFVAFDGGAPVGEPVELLTGFVDERGQALGRPVGVAFDATGALLVADDVGNVVWRVASAPAAAQARASRETPAFTVTGVLAPSERPADGESSPSPGLLPVAPSADAAAGDADAAGAAVRRSGAPPATSGLAVVEPARTASSESQAR